MVVLIMGVKMKGRNKIGFIIIGLLKIIGLLIWKNFGIVFIWLMFFKWVEWLKDIKIINVKVVFELLIKM